MGLLESVVFFKEKGFNFIFHICPQLRILIMHKCCNKKQAETWSQPFLIKPCNNEYELT